MLNCNALMIIDNKRYIITDKMYDHNCCIYGEKLYGVPLRYESARIIEADMVDDVVSFVSTIRPDEIKKHIDEYTLFMYIPSNDDYYNYIINSHNKYMAEYITIEGKNILDIEIEVDDCNDLHIKNIYGNTIGSNPVRKRLIDNILDSYILHALYKSTLSIIER